MLLDSFQGRLDFPSPPDHSKLDYRLIGPRVIMLSILSSIRLGRRQEGENPKELRRLVVSSAESLCRVGESNQSKVAFA